MGGALGGNAVKTHLLSKLPGGRVGTDAGGRKRWDHDTIRPDTRRQ